MCAAGPGPLGGERRVHRQPAVRAGRARGRRHGDRPGCPAGAARHAGRREALRAAHARGARLVSICAGAYTLAAAGLLDGAPGDDALEEHLDCRQPLPRVKVGRRCSTSTAATC